jgi:CRISPR system Cascade subunit CasE
MFLSRVEVSWTKSKNLYDLHKAVWKLFPGVEKETRERREESRQGFLFHIEENKSGHPASLLVQSNRKPQNKAESAFLKTCKEFNPQPNQGQRLAFFLTANPVKTIKDEEGRLNSKGKPKQCRVPLIREEHQFDWLAERLKGIASIEAIKTRPLPPAFFYKHKEKRSGKLVPVRFEGIIHVEDPQALLKLLEDGIGPAKAFGCGLMLVRRV